MVLISKAVKEFFSIHNEETLEMILRMNEKYNLYDGHNFTWQYDPDDSQWHCIASNSDEYMCGIVSEYAFPPILIDFAIMEDDSYCCTCDVEFDF